MSDNRDHQDVKSIEDVERWVRFNPFSPIAAIWRSMLHNIQSSFGGHDVEDFKIEAHHEEIWEK